MSRLSDMHIIINLDLHDMIEWYTNDNGPWTTSHDWVTCK